jgi:hypothetical protein
MTVAAIPNDTVAALVLKADQSWPQEYEKARTSYFAPAGGRRPRGGFQRRWGTTRSCLVEMPVQHPHHRHEEIREVAPHYHEVHTDMRYGGGGAAGTATRCGCVHETGGIEMRCTSCSGERPGCCELSIPPLDRDDQHAAG